MSLLLILSVVVFVTTAKPGFNYPPEMPDPISAQNALFLTIIPIIFIRETPIQIRITSAIDTVTWNCLAYYHPTVLDAIIKKRPRILVDSNIIDKHGNSETRAMCMAYSFAIISAHLMSDSVEPMLNLIDSFGLDTSFTVMNEDVLSCDVDDTKCLQTVAEDYGFTPNIIASIVSYYMIDYLSKDGWNADGKLTPVGKCTANCEPYSDYTEYYPVNNPYKTEQAYPIEVRWAPLQQTDGKGFLYHHDHVVPHIGQTGKTKLISRKELESKYAADPNYDYHEEILLTIDRLKETATNDTRKMLIEHFDNKLFIAFGLISNLDTLLNWSWEERQLFIVGLTTAEYESIIQVWLEKRRWDLVRPTTLIKKKGRKKITTWGGPFTGVQNINSHDFEAYIRVMPHSEYPSASGCICTSVTEFTDLFVEELYGVNELSEIIVPSTFQPFLQHSSIIEPGLTPQKDLIVTMNNLIDFRETCKASRLWGGLHFTAAVEAAEELCSGLGVASMEFVMELLNGYSL